METDKKFYIYCLFRPWNLEPCYIGKGHGKRMNFHSRMGSSHPNMHLAQVFKKAGESEVPCAILHSDLDEATAFEYETALIKAIGRSDLKTGPLCNWTDGGEGSCGAVISDETRAKMSRSQTGKKMSPEAIEKTRQANLGKIFSQERREKIRARALGRKHTDEMKAKVSAANLGKIISEETRKKISLAHKLRIESGFPPPSLGRKASEESRAKMSLAQRGKIVSEEGRARMRAAKANMSEETRRKMSESAKLRCARKNSASLSKGVK